MAIDPRILLAGVTPNPGEAATQGFKLGQAIRNAPLLRQQREQQLVQSEQQTQAGRLALGQKGAIAINSIIGDATAEQITPESFQQSATALQSLGVPLQQTDLEFNPTNVNRLVQLSQAGKRIAQGQVRAPARRVFEGDLTFRDEEGNIFSQQTFADPETGETRAQLTDISTRRAQPVGKLTPIGATGETIQEKRTAEVQQKTDIAQNIQDVKTSGLAEGEQEKLLGVERGKIATGIRTGSSQAKRSKSSILKLKRALGQVKTGRLASARNILGNIIPGIRDADAEVFNSMASQFALDELSKQSGTKTDFDFQKAAETQARLGNTQEANERIIEIALDRFDELENEERQFKEFVKGGGNAEDFEYQPIPPEFIDLMRANPDDKKMRADFKAKFGFLPTGL